MIEGLVIDAATMLRRVKESRALSVAFADEFLYRLHRHVVRMLSVAHAQVDGVHGRERDACVAVAYLHIEITQEIARYHPETITGVCELSDDAGARLYLFAVDTERWNRWRGMTCTAGFFRRKKLALFRKNFLFSLK